MAKTTSNTNFHSKSGQLGSTRWQFDLDPLVPRGYLVNCAHMPSLSSVWWMIGLVKIGPKLYLRSVPAGNASEMSLEPGDLTALVSQTPELDLEVATDDVQAAIYRLERGVANVMHGLLEPTATVASLWAKILSSDDPQNLYR